MPNFTEGQLNQSGNHGDDPGHVVLKTAFGLIAGSSFLTNSLLCYLILRNRQMLTSSYNVFIFSLAVTDMLTGIFLAVTPGYIMSLSSITVSTSLAGQVFCRVIGSQYIVYSLGKISAFTVTTMAIERWYAVTKPAKYRTMFSLRRVIGYIVLMWFLSYTIHSSVFFEMSVDIETSTCAWSPSGFDKRPIVTVSTLVTFFLPMVVTWVTYLHIAVSLRSTPKAATSSRYSKARVRLLRTCMLVALLLSICWFPNQIYYVLSAYDLVVLETPLHRFTIVLVMFNSCINPFIYCFSNREYKRAFLSMCSSCTEVCCRHNKSVDLSPPEGASYTVRALTSGTVGPTVEPPSTGVVLTSLSPLDSQPHYNRSDWYSRCT